MKVRLCFLLLPVALLMTAFPACQRPDTTYWPDGTIKSRVSYDREGKIEGVACWYYQDGTAQLEASYSNGVLDGHLYRWQENGVKLYEGQYSRGKLNGMCTEWNFAGKKILEQTYRDGLLHGPCAEWYPSGQKLSEGQYLDGFMEGQWLWWDIGGNIMARGDFVKGTGDKRIINPMGREIGKVRYIDNVEQPNEFNLNSF